MKPLRIIKTKYLSLALMACMAMLCSSCDFLFGTKQDDQVEDIFNNGKTDPNIAPENVGYVPVLPVWSSFKNPTDVFVGYDEMVYVTDDEGLKILDLKGQLHRTIPIYKATDVVQDRRIHTYVIGKVIVNVFGQARELSCVYHLKNTASATGAVFVDTLIHPFCDISRNNIPFRLNDLEVSFTGLAVLFDNTLYVSRKGTLNDLTSSARPDNTVLIFSPDGKNTSYCKGLNPLLPNLKSVINTTAIASFIGPPQKLFGVSESYDFILCQGSGTSNIEFKTLWIKRFVDPDAGVEYGENADLLVTDFTKADGFLYEPNKFLNPEDVYVAPDQSGYIFVVDGANNRFYQFTQKGWEGVPPPPYTGISKNIKVSFGKKGDDLFSFNHPSGVCYYDKVVYIADKGNNRILRYKLNTDFE